MAPKHPKISPLIIQPKDRYAAFKSTSLASRTLQETTLKTITSFFDLNTLSISINAMLGSSPISEHTKFCTEPWWKRKVEGVFEAWLTLLKCPVCGRGVEEVYNGVRKVRDKEEEKQTKDSVKTSSTAAVPSGMVSILGGVKVREGTQSQENVDMSLENPILPEVPSLASTTLLESTSTTSITPSPDEGLVHVHNRKDFNEDPWELLAGSKNVLLDSNPWELTQESLDEIRDRWNRGSELFLFEEEEHLRAYEDCNGFKGREWVFI